jgi:hypothetical protein
MSPITEQRPVNGPVVYGYLRLSNQTRGRQAALTKTLLDYCQTHELVLANIFIERLSAENISFTGLLDVLAMENTYGVVIPTLTHLGRKPLAAARCKRIKHTRSRLLIIRPQPRRHTNCHTPAERWVSQAGVTQ